MNLIFTPSSYLCVSLLIKYLWITQTACLSTCAHARKHWAYRPSLCTTRISAVGRSLPDPPWEWLRQPSYFLSTLILWPLVLRARKLNALYFWTPVSRLHQFGAQVRNAREAESMILLVSIVRIILGFVCFSNRRILKGPSKEFTNSADGRT